MKLSSSRLPSSAAGRSWRSSRSVSSRRAGHKCPWRRAALILTLACLGGSLSSAQVQRARRLGCAMYPGPQISASSYPGDVQSADMDGDGSKDLVVREDGLGEVAVFLNSDGAFATESRYHTNGGYIALADLDGDGDVDVVSAEAASTNRVKLFRNQSNGRLVFAGYFPAGTLPSGVAVGD